jgi:hypothetical protein
MKEVESTVLVDDMGALVNQLRPVVADLRIVGDEETVVLRAWPRLLGIFTMCLRVNVNQLDAIQVLRLGFDETPNWPLSKHIDGVLAQCMELRQEISDFEEKLAARLLQAQLEEAWRARQETTGDCSQQSPVGLVPEPLGLSA